MNAEKFKIAGCVLHDIRRKISNRHATPFCANVLVPRTAIAQSAFPEENGVLKNVQI